MAHNKRSYKLFYEVASFSCRVCRGIYKTSSKKRWSRLQKWQQDFSRYLGSINISSAVACFLREIPSGIMYICDWTKYVALCNYCLFQFLKISKLSKHRQHLNCSRLPDMELFLVRFLSDRSCRHIIFHDMMIVF